MAGERDLLTALSQRPVVFDGAMGTQIYERGVLYTQNFDQLCVTRADLVKSVHAGYLAAGAEVLQTNTFGANRYRLALHNLEGQLEAINRAGVRIAREVAGDQAWVAGSIGPSGKILKSVRAGELDELREAFRDQAAVLLDEGVDALILETFRQPEEVRLAIEGAKLALDATAEDKRCPIIASVSFDSFGTMADGTGPEEMAQRLVAWGADVIGVNCADGPAGVYETATKMLGAGRPIVAQPNAGLPRRVEGRFAYMATPDYFLVFARRMLKAGVRGIGGCCGTTPEHVRQMAAAARMVGATGEVGGPEIVSLAGAHELREATPQVAPGVTRISLAEKGPLGAKIGKKFVVSVEVNPPAGLSPQKALDAARMLRDGGVDVINVADGARATARMGNFALCHRIQDELGMPAIMHVTTRDRNLLGLVAHLLGCHELGLTNLVVITGDPPKMGDFPDATPVYDVDSVGLLRLIDGMNRGFDPGGKPLGGATRFLLATGAEPAAKDYQRELDRLKKKREAGAEIVMTQPVYDPDVLDRFLNDVASLEMPVLVGLLPLASYRNAEFLHNEVPGMSVPHEIRERMRKAGAGEEARREGVAIAREMLLAVKSRVAGAYIMPPLGRYELALRVIDGVV
ncbi:bifunctional homocysteine S-methyltransferase/methylenetetrahydrofolate reductase [Sandaracinus amylolyticus]|uniref:bifunctional homocysteine S-methyltransferase/methylenetetrahydrofolate reductase n=1 Tax=Sandaracinus amylolyticus TaxID=927083 RepID=UPI001F1BA7BD|nr:bifunctional homocysteine S-methyltransferase/methylenetetrahydrofolate reductase [Sandaracinus amylolyticus]UJR80199.1 Bifunctional homocysteine S-methyltransferase/methylenetetrahydrofolate reductase [Sandaracinus amylolyticus]